MCHLTPIKLFCGARGTSSFVVFNLGLLYYHLNGMDEGFARREFTTDSMLLGHHVYQEVWIPVTGEYFREQDNSQDHYAVAV